MLALKFKQLRVCSMQQAFAFSTNNNNNKSNFNNKGGRDRTTSKSRDADKAYTGRKYEKPRRDRSSTSEHNEEQNIEFKSNHKKQGQSPSALKVVNEERSYLRDLDEGDKIIRPAKVDESQAKLKWKLGGASLKVQEEAKRSLLAEREKGKQKKEEEEFKMKIGGSKAQQEALKPKHNPLKQTFHVAMLLMGCGNHSPDYVQLLKQQHQQESQIAQKEGDTKKIEYDQSYYDSLLIGSNILETTALRNALQKQKIQTKYFSINSPLYTNDQQNQMKKFIEEKMKDLEKKNEKLIDQEGKKSMLRYIDKDKEIDKFDVYFYDGEFS